MMAYVSKSASFCITSRPLTVVGVFHTQSILIYRQVPHCVPTNAPNLLLSTREKRKRIDWSSSLCIAGTEPTVTLCQ